MFNNGNMLSWAAIVSGGPAVPVSMGKTGASPSQRKSPSQSALLAVDAILAANPQRELPMTEILRLYRFYQAIAFFESNQEIMLNQQKKEATIARDIVEARRVENLMERTIDNLSKHVHFIDMLFSHGPSNSNLTGRRNSLDSVFSLNEDLYYSKAREILHELLTSVYFREVAIFILALMALRGQFDDKDARGTCREKVDSDLAAAWVSKLTDPRLLNMYTEATCMNHDKLWHYKIGAILTVVEE